MARNQLGLTSWAWMGATPGLGFIIWLGLRYGAFFQPDIRGLIALSLSTVITGMAAYIVHLRQHAQMRKRRNMV